ncbi:MAG: hypothetical protein PHW80_07875 [Smithellaceae bacterium]|nr:hypothetical protein [Smithellaceae bacterium]MDD3259972.1 hypothetical protein [Smithellaceae bacterium]MDD3849203.1 hypothetical protein [Smithellaceae bacterium]HOG12849.1 hypothetical protein [Smithellaceae bacterium]
MKKKIIMILCTVVVLIGALLVKTLWNAGEFQSLSRLYAAARQEHREWAALMLPVWF